MIKSKKAVLNDIYDEYRKSFHGLDIVQGAGNIDSDIVFIGEAPGKDEIKQKMPFVGKAGLKLSDMLRTLGLDRDDIYITNAIKHSLRETDIISGRQRNRPATRNEILWNMPYLLRELECLDPGIIVTLGAVPLKALLGRFSITVSGYAGREFGYNGRMIYPMYHPAALIYDPKLDTAFKRDLEKLKNILMINAADYKEIQHPKHVKTGRFY